MDAIARQNRQDSDYRRFIGSDEGQSWLNGLPEAEKIKFLANSDTSYREEHAVSPSMDLSSAPVCMQQGELVCVATRTPLHELSEAEEGGAELGNLLSMSGEGALLGLLLFCFRKGDANVVYPLRRFVAIAYQMRPDLLPKARLESLAPWLGFRNRSGLSSFILKLERETGVHGRNQKKVLDRGTYSASQQGHPSYRDAKPKPPVQRDFLMEAIGE